MRRRPLLLLCALAALGTVRCAPDRDVSRVPAALAPEGPISAEGPASGWIAVVAYDAWSRILVGGATVTCHETGAVVTTDTAGRAWIQVPPPPFTITGGAPGFGLATIVAAGSATIGLPLPRYTPRTVGTRGTVQGIVDITASRVEVPDGRGGLDPFLGTLGSDTYQLTMMAGRNFRSTALEIGSGGLRNIVVSPLQWKLPAHKTVGTVNMSFPVSPPLMSSCSGALNLPVGFVPATIEVRGRARTDLQDVALGEGVVVGWATIGPLSTTYTLDYAPTAIAGLSATDLIIDGRVTDGAGNASQARVPHAGGASATRFPLSAGLTFPAIPFPTSPLVGATGVGRSPTLAWTATVAANGGAYLVTLRDAAASVAWDCWVPGGTAGVTLPTLPPPLAAKGFTAGNPVTWSVRAYHCPAFDWRDASLRRLALDATGTTQTQPAGFTP